MCDQDNLARWARSALDRRSFGAGALAASVAACAPVGDSGQAGTASSAARGVVRENVTFATADGTLDGEFYHAPGTKAPGVVLWPDIAGIRPAKRQMAQRLAAAGYSVLLANPYYRDVAGQQFAEFADFAGNGGWDKVTPWRSKFSVDTIKRDDAACAEWLAGRATVDAARGMGVQGYCMTGSFALIGPAASPRIRAGGSFHGGGLVRAEGPSPHKTLRAGAHYLVAIGQNDDAKAPAEKDALRAAATAAGAMAEIEVYPADHGWCVPDSPSYDEIQAERAWARLLATYKAAL